MGVSSKFIMVVTLTKVSVFCLLCVHLIGGSPVPDPAPAPVPLPVPAPVAAPEPFLGLIGRLLGISSSGEGKDKEKKEKDCYCRRFFHEKDKKEKDKDKGCNCYRAPQSSYGSPSYGVPCRTSYHGKKKRSPDLKKKNNKTRCY